ncbi:MAG: C40 family peptidase, partial [Clostridia bacterium]|nr:C40 family peptidase [Clostridia bacterium]
ISISALCLAACKTDSDKPDMVPPVQIQPPVSGGDEPQDKEDEKRDTVLISTVNSLNVRTGKGSSYASLGTIDKGDGLAKLSEIEDGWYRTVYKEKTAYVSASYVTEMQFDMADEATERVISEGKKLLGHPYVWGSQRYHWGNGVLNTNFKAGQFDCSALMQYIFYKGAGVLLDLNTRTQVLQGSVVDVSQLKRGDLMFFTNSSRVNKTGIERVGHVALYLGNNYILHTASDYAVIERISDARWNYYIQSNRAL